MNILRVYDGKSRKCFGLESKALAPIHLTDGILSLIHILSEELEDVQVLKEWLSAKRGGKVEIRVPQKGTKEKLVELAADNARMVLSKDKERLRREERRTTGAVKELEELIGRSGLERMEAYDISNTNGFESVGSMVVYEHGKPKRNDYRKFKIKGIQGPDDYGSMKEVLTRRFTHGLEERRNYQAQSEEMCIRDRDKMVWWGIRL